MDGFHFAYEDGSRYSPWGTTAYAWTHQSDALQDATLATLADAPFTKMRMCLLPKSYLFNTEEPERLPFVRTEEGFDATRFDVESFTRLEARIQQLAELGIEADLILFHPYDRWGFVDMGPAIDDRLVRYTVRRLAAFANVWWSLSNEFDLIPTKKFPDWERLAAVIAAEDPHGHLLGNHNCVTFFDNSQPWITHSSLQRIDVYRTAENTDAWRERWGKPVVIDEIGYEGDLEHGWGNLIPQELLRRCWEGAVRGGYVGHGETFVNDRDELWWSKGGELIGATPERIGFLAQIVAEAPNGVLDPCPSDWDLPWGGVEGEYLVGYFGFSAPRYRTVRLPEGEFRVDVIDTWNMTVEPLAGTYREQVEVPMPARAVDGDPAGAPGGVAGRRGRAVEVRHRTLHRVDPCARWRPSRLSPRRVCPAGGCECGEGRPPRGQDDNSCHAPCAFSRNARVVRASTAPSAPRN